jgi:hypothetical protein
MKKLLLLALAIVMTTTFAFAQSRLTEKQKSTGEAYGKRLVEYVLTNNQYALTELHKEVRAYSDTEFDAKASREKTEFMRCITRGIEDECRRLGWDPYEEHLALRLMKALYEGIIE